MSHTTANKEFWQQFIQFHRSLPELWKVKSDVYKNRNLKDAGCNELVEKLREIKEDADRNMVCKENRFRTAYRRELKRITDSTKSVIGTEDIYVPDTSADSSCNQGRRQLEFFI
jgi:C-terminal processing protease CtpA/Prc